MTSKGERFVQEFVIGFGFLNGIFFAIGIDPEGLLIQTLIDLIAELNPEMAGLYAIVFGIVSILILIVFVLASYSFGGVIGLIAVIIAFISGAILLSFAIGGAILLILAILLGLFAPESNYKSVL